MNAGDYVLVTIGVPGLNALHAVARVNCGAGVLLGEPPEGFFSLDVNMGVTHLPQKYAEKEVQLLVNEAYHGFCTKCRGWGLTTMFDNAELDQILAGQHGEVCPDCGGSGRVGYKIEVTRDNKLGAEAHIAYPANFADGIECPDCKAGFTPQVKGG